jgi:hypothetical protein
LFFGAVIDFDLDKTPFLLPGDLFAGCMGGQMNFAHFLGHAVQWKDLLRRVSGVVGKLLGRQLGSAGSNNALLNELAGEKEAPLWKYLQLARVRMAQ